MMLTHHNLIAPSAWLAPSAPVVHNTSGPLVGGALLTTLYYKKKKKKFHDVYCRVLLSFLLVSNIPKS